MKENKILNNDIILIEYINNTIYGNLAHFFSINEGNYYSRVIEDEKILIYDRLTLEEENKYLESINEYEEF